MAGGNNCNGKTLSWGERERASLRDGRRNEVPDKTIRAGLPGKGPLIRDLKETRK